ncbi:craniofacial development protein 2-like [Amphiura filiformis]|uniref:craniofacial development protein 2-like n=1 Tax=Amphiura filiformis TaxID=82378 RepID=UPI003B2118D6
MTRLKINILGINETRWTNNGDFKIDDFKTIYAGGDKHEKGVGLMLDADMAKCVLGYWTVSERVLLVKLQGQPFNISVIVVYAPTAESTEEEIDAFYDKLEEAKS